VIVSIVSYITAPGSSGLVPTFQAGGVFYYHSQVALTEFAQAATVPEWAVLLTYGGLALVLAGIALGILSTRLVPEGLTGPSVVVVFGLTVVSVMLSALFVFATIAGYTNVLGALTGVLQITPPLLTLSPVAVAIAVVTSYVP
jgi:hypothetical protein